MVRYASGLLCDDTGPYFPLGGTLFWALHGWQVWPDRLRQTLAWVRSFKHDYLRILADVDWSSNAGYQIDSSAPDFRAVLGAYLDCAWKEYGLRTEVTVWGGSARDPIAAAQAVADVVNAGRQAAIQNLEAANEAYQNGPDYATQCRMVAILKTTGCLVAPSEPGDAETTATELAQHIADGATLGAVHLDRAPGAHGERFVRQPYGLKDLRGFPITHNEPIGPRSSVCESVDPSKLSMLRLMGIFYGATEFVLHNGNGVTGLADPAHDRGGDLWSVPGIDQIMQAVRACDGLLPVDIAAYSKTNQHGGYTDPNFADYGQPLAADTIWSDHQAAHGCDRCYGATTPTGFVTMISDVVSWVELRAARAAHVQIFNVLTPATPVLEADVPAGGILKLSSSGDYVARGTYR